MNARQLFQSVQSKTQIRGRCVVKERRILVCILALGLLLALAVGLSQAQGPEPPEGDVRPQGETGVTAIVGDAIPIQGRLTDANGDPLPDGDYTLTFRLYDIVGGGTPLCVDVDGPPDDPDSRVHVADGLFSAYMNFCTADVFDGQQLYLGIEVGDDGEMTPRQYIYAVPYAWSLRPGAIISGSKSGSILLVENTDGGGDSYAVWGQSSGGGFGVVGRSDSGPGVYGWSPSGYAGYFDGDVGQSRADDGLVKAAVYADCGNAGSSITRSFNHVSGTITIANGASAGRCTIDFGFRIDDRYFVATAFTAGVGAAARGVSCDWGADNEKLDCFRWNDAGSGANGGIMVLIY